MAFFEQVFDRLGETYPAIRAPRSKAASWWSFASGPFGYYSLSFSRKGYRVENYLDTGQKDSTKALFDDLYPRRTDLAQRLGSELDWERLDANRGSRIACYYDDQLDPMLTTRRWISLPGGVQRVSKSYIALWTKSCEAWPSSSRTRSKRSTSTRFVSLFSERPLRHRLPVLQQRPVRALLPV